MREPADDGFMCQFSSLRRPVFLFPGAFCVHSHIASVEQIPNMFHSAAGLRYFSGFLRSNTCRNPSRGVYLGLVWKRSDHVVNPSLSLSLSISLLPLKSWTLTQTTCFVCCCTSKSKRDSRTMLCVKWNLQKMAKFPKIPKMQLHLCVCVCLCLFSILLCACALILVGNNDKEKRPFYLLFGIGNRPWNLSTLNICSVSDTKKISPRNFGNTCLTAHAHKQLL